MRNYPFIVLMFIAFLCGFSGYSQGYFQVSTDVPVRSQGNLAYQNAWSGGLNHMQYSAVDLNLDGVQDLFVFDRSGDKISTFINSGIVNSVEYSYNPVYRDSFPNLHDWVLFRDYNCDGKMDIFTYSTGGMAIYKNTSDASLSFELVTELLTSNYNPDTGNNFINLYVSSSDIPAIDDIDGDGDLDILTFSILGNYVEYHKNLSQELYGSCDSLVFNVANKCWGYFAENLSDNSVTIQDSCAQNVVNPEVVNQDLITKKHAGSTLLTLDVDNNGSKDLVLGDVSFNNMTLLYNTDVSSNLTASNITSQDNSFPSNNLGTLPVNLKLFPAGYYIDVDNDGVKDLIVAANCNSGCENAKSSWLYLNEGTNSLPDFNFIKSNFLQDEMVELGEATHPVFFDYNMDGVMDLVVGNTGYYDTTLVLSYKSSLHLFENIGTNSNPDYKLIDDDYAGLSTMNLDLNGGNPTLSLRPTFGDLDDDGDEDMIFGDYLGKLHYFTNTAGPGNPAVFVLQVVEYGGFDVGSFAAPQLVDLNRDDKLDLVVGKNNGYFSYFENTGTTSNPQHTLVTDSLGYVSTLKEGYFQGNSVPFVFDENGNYKMFAGSLDGSIYLFGNIDNNLNGTFNELDSNFLSIREGSKTSISLSDINSDSRLDMIIGNTAGGLALYKGAVPPISVNEHEFVTKLNIYPNPAKESLTVAFEKQNITSIELFDILGVRIKKVNKQGRVITVSLNEVPKGVYILRVNSTVGSVNRKIIKE